MEIKIVTSSLCFLLLSTIGMAQEKYLLYKPDKDSILNCANDISYYKIDGNLFDIDRYGQVDTISAIHIKNLKISTVKELWKDGKVESERIFENIEEGQPIPTIDTYNLIFEHIYVIEEISNCRFKRVRVWWVDY